MTPAEPWAPKGHQLLQKPGSPVRELLLNGVSAQAHGDFHDSEQLFNTRDAVTQRPALRMSVWAVGAEKHK